MISKKHTSKFVAGFLQGLGLVACVSFTSCGDKDSADKQKREGLAKTIEERCNDLAEKQKNAIVNLCMKKNVKPEELNETDLENLHVGLTDGEINKILSSEENQKVTIYFSDKHVLFDLGDSKVVSRLLEGDFLRYEQVFSPDYETKKMNSEIYDAELFAHLTMDPLKVSSDNISIDFLYRVFS